MTAPLRTVEREALSEPRPLIDGASFILDTPAEVDAVWGDSDGAVLWAAGEPLMVAAPQGVGKTTLAQRLILGRIGLCPTLLGMPVAHDERRVLYIAADRPKQAARSFARMVSEEDRAALEERLRLWRGPLPVRLSDAGSETFILELCESAEAGTIVFDSLKDIASSLSEEAPASHVSQVFQALVAADIEVLALHHQRKATADNKKPTSLNDVYGSTWLTAGMGSVLLLWGEPGDTLVELRHLKQPADPVGPYTIIHDHLRGLPALHQPPDPAVLLRQAGADGLTVAELAGSIFKKARPEPNEIEKARRKLDKLVKAGRATHVASLIPTDAGCYVWAEEAP